MAARSWREARIDDLLAAVSELGMTMSRAAAGEESEVDPMSTSSAEDPVPGIVTFTARGDAALDQLADALVAESDGSPASIADLLERVLEADIEDLAETLSTTARPAATGREEVQELGPAPESPDEAAHRRLGARTPGAIGGPGTRGLDVGRWPDTTAYTSLHNAGM